jgi:hypothetical protein
MECSPSHKGVFSISIVLLYDFDRFSSLFEKFHNEKLSIKIINIESVGSP